MARRTARTVMIWGTIGAALMLAGCGGGASEPDADADASADPADEETDADEGDAEEGDAAGDGEETVEEAREFFAGENIDFVVPFEPGGGFDFYARQIAPFLEEELGTTVVVRNEPGAGGLSATNATYAADGDGLRLLLLDTPGVITSQLGGAEGARYEAAEFTWLARITGEPDIVASAADGDIQSFDDLIEQTSADDPARVAVLGPGDISLLEALLIEELFDINVELIPGFDGAPAAQTAVIRGESDIYMQSLSGSTAMIAAGDVTGLGLFGNETMDEAPGVPTILSLLEESGADEEAIQTLRTHNALLATGRSIVAAPGVSDARTQLLREAFEAVSTNEELLAALEEQGRPFQFLNGDEIDAIAQEAANDVPQPYLDIVDAATEIG